jgi:hypothetical protein
MQPVWTTTSIDLKDRQKLQTAVLRGRKLVDFLHCISTCGCVHVYVYNTAISEVTDQSFMIATFVLHELVFINRHREIFRIIIFAMHRSVVIIRTNVIHLQTPLHLDIQVGVT